MRARTFFALAATAVRGLVFQVVAAAKQSTVTIAERTERPR